MKITHIIMNIDAGGAQTFVASLAIEQKKLGHDVSIIIIDELIHSNFQLLLINSLKEHAINIHLLNRKAGRNITIINTFKGIIETLAASRPDVINSHISTSHLLVSMCLKFVTIRKLKDRHIITVHNAPENWSWMTRMFNKRTPTIYCSNSALELNEKRDCMGVAIQNGVPKFKINGSSKHILEQFNGGKHRKFVLCVGRLSRQKNYEMVCRIAKHFDDKNIDFLVCGIKHETAEKDLRSFSEIANIHYLGIKTQDEIYSLMGNCDCFLNASLFEGLPITVLEAFFSGIPCVLSNIAPHIEIGTDMPYCYIAALDSKESFIDKIEMVLKENSNKEEISNLRRPFLKKYSITTTATNYVDFYNNVLEKHGAKGLYRLES
jgi:glycosyltransferase involved in cell wall biosynthesis